jgi:micrococcal nuclease
LLSGCLQYPQGGYSSRVVYVYDGDTIRLVNGEKVRYLGIDTPEMNYKNPPAEYFAKDAKAFNQGLVGGKIVRLEFDARERDKYQRLLAYVYVDDIFINKKMIEEGYAKILIFPPNEKYADEFLKLQRKARQESKGIWAK